MDFEERPQAVCGNCRQPSEQPPSMTAFMRKLLPMS
nr:unknown [Neurospora crassa]